MKVLILGNFNLNFSILSTFADVASCVFYSWVSIYIWEQAKAESVVVIIWRVGESVHNDAVVLCMIHLSHPAVELIVGNTAPVLRLLVRHWFCIYHIWGWVARCCVHLGIHTRYRWSSNVAHHLVFLWTVGRWWSLRAEGERRLRVGTTGTGGERGNRR